MGRRMLRVSGELLVDLCKAHDDRRFFLVTKDALPDDARLVRVLEADLNRVQLVVESAEWPETGDLVELLPGPEFTVCFEEVRG